MPVGRRRHAERRCDAADSRVTAESLAPDLPRRNGPRGQADVGEAHTSRRSSRLEASDTRRRRRRAGRSVEVATDVTPGVAAYQQRSETAPVGRRATGVPPVRDARAPDARARRSGRRFGLVACAGRPAHRLGASSVAQTAVAAQVGGGVHRAAARRAGPRAARGRRGTGGRPRRAAGRVASGSRGRGAQDAEEARRRRARRARRCAASARAPRGR